MQFHVLDNGFVMHQYDLVPAAKGSQRSKETERNKIIFCQNILPLVLKVFETTNPISAMAMRACAFFNATETLEKN